MKSRVSSTVTKRKPNPRPRKYASASERQAAYRARAPEVCFRAEEKTVETLDRIAETLDQSRADVLLSMTKFALANHDWARFGLTHKPLPFEYGVNPIMATKKRKPTPAQMAARERFAEMARAGSFKKAGGRKKNPDNMGSYGPFYGDTDAPMTEAQIERKAESYMDRLDRQLMRNEITQTVYDREVKALDKWAKDQYARRRKTNPAPAGGTWLVHLVGKPQSWYATKGSKAAAVRMANMLNKELGEIGYEVSEADWSRKTNPARKAAGVRSNPAPAKQRMGRIVRVDPKTGVPFGTELVPIDFAFKEYVGNYQQDFFARTEGAQLVVSEKTTGAKVGAVPFTLRSAALNDRAAAKAFVQKTVEKVGADRFNAAIAKAPKLTA